jgi:hypothetical protein
MKFSIKDKIVAFFTSHFNPEYAVQLNRYSKVWNDKLLKLMKENEFVSDGKYTAKLGNVSIWIGNYPNACFHPYKTGEYEIKVRPSLMTIRLAKMQYDRQVKSQAQIEDEFIEAI